MSEADGSGSTPLPKFAFVKYDPSFGIDTEVVKVKHIRVQEDHKNAACRRPFKPRNNLDFKQDMWYVVRTKKRTKDSKEKNFWALIGRLHESEVGLIDSLNEAGRGKRVSFPPLDAPETEPESTDAEPRIRNSIVNEAREVRLTKKRRKHDSEVKDMETYVRKSAPSNVALGDSPDSDQETVDMNNITMDEYVDNSALPNDSHEERANSSNVTAQSIDKDTGANRNSSFTSETSLQSSILDLMNMIQGLKEEVRDIKSIREEFKDMKKQVEDCSSKVDKMAENIINVQQSIRSSTARSVSAVSTVSSPDEMVDWLGPQGESAGVPIRRTKLEQMQYVEKECEWANLFLEGCFDEDKVPHMRCCTRRDGDPNSIQIPKKTLTFAKKQFTAWLSSKGNDTVYVSERRAKFGTTVGAAAMAHLGKRGLPGELQRAQEAGDEDKVREISSKMREAAQRRLSSHATRGYDHHNATPQNRRRGGRPTLESAPTTPAASAPATPTASAPTTPVASAPASPKAPMQEAPAGTSSIASNPLSKITARRLEDAAVAANQGTSAGSSQERTVPFKDY